MPCLRRSQQPGPTVGVLTAEDGHGPVSDRIPADLLHASGSTGIDHEQYIDKQRRWLLFLRHCARCRAGDCSSVRAAAAAAAAAAGATAAGGGSTVAAGRWEGVCELGVPLCMLGRQLWAHLLACGDAGCEYPRCRSSRRLLVHHRKCRAAGCPVCVPVREYAKQEAVAVQQRRHQQQQQHQGQDGDGAGANAHASAAAAPAPPRGELIGGGPVGAPATAAAAAAPVASVVVVADGGSEGEEDDTAQSPPTPGIADSARWRPYPVRR